MKVFSNFYVITLGLCPEICRLAHFDCYVGCGFLLLEFIFLFVRIPCCSIVLLSWFVVGIFSLLCD
jgi:hypothetical protein